MDHERCSELLSPFARGELSEEERADVATHVDGCDACGRELQAVRALLAVEVAPLTSDERATLARAITAERAAEQRVFTPTPRRSWRARLAPALGIATLVAVVAAGSLLLGDSGDDDADSGLLQTEEELEDLGGDAAEGETRPSTRERRNDRTKRGITFETDADAVTPNRKGKASKDTTSMTTDSAGGQGQQPPASSDDAEPEPGGDTGEGEPAPAPAEGGTSGRSVSISPSSASGSVGSCSAFTITVKDADDRPQEGVRLDVEQRHESADDGNDDNEPSVSFCIPGSGPNASDVSEGSGDLSPPEEDPDNAGTAGGETVASTNSDGRITIGIRVEAANGSDGSGQVSLVAFIDSPDDDDPAGDPRDSAQQNWNADARLPLALLFHLAWSRAGNLGPPVVVSVM